MAGAHALLVVPMSWLCDPQAALFGQHWRDWPRKWVQRIVPCADGIDCGAGGISGGTGSGGTGGTGGGGNGGPSAVDGGEAGAGTSGTQPDVDAAVSGGGMTGGGTGGAAGGAGSGVDGGVEGGTGMDGGVEPVDLPSWS